MTLFEGIRDLPTSITLNLAKMSIHIMILGLKIGSIFSFNSFDRLIAQSLLLTHHLGAIETQDLCGYFTRGRKVTEVASSAGPKKRNKIANRSSPSLEHPNYKSREIK